MVDFIYNAIRRPVANEPDKKDIYHVDKTPKDARAKRIEEDDPSNQQQQSTDEKSAKDEQSSHPDDNQNKLIKASGTNNQNNEHELTPKKQGKGKYVDENGVEHLDFYA